jgi:hypothetical protein
MLFTLSGNAPPKDLKQDLESAADNRDQYAVNLQISDHQEFIAETYDEALDLGNK